MKDYEKLIMFLEMQNEDVSPFLKLKKNELALDGAFEIFNKNTYKEVLADTTVSEIYQNNVFFMSLGKLKFSKKLSEMMIVNHKSGELVTIKEVYEDESLTDQEKHEIVYKGVEKLNNEYKRFMSYLTINNQTVLKDYNKLFDQDKRNHKRNKLIKKNIVFFYILAFVMIVMDALFLKTSYLKEKMLFVNLYNGLLVLLITIPIFKKIYLQYFSNRVSINNQRINRFFTKCDLLLDVNDKNFSRIEKDLYRFSTDSDKDKTITYVQHTNKLLKQLDRHVEFIFRLNSIQIGDQIIDIFLKVVNLLPIIGLGLLLLLALI